MKLLVKPDPYGALMPEYSDFLTSINASVRKRRTLRVHAALVRAKHTVLKSLKVEARIAVQLPIQKTGCNLEHNVEIPDIIT